MIMERLGLQLILMFLNLIGDTLKEPVENHQSVPFFYLAYPTKTGSQTQKPLLDQQLYKTTDFGHTISVLKSSTIAVVYMPYPDDILWTATYTSNLRSLNLYVSQDNGATLIDTDFPENLVEKVSWFMSYKLMDW